MARAGTSFPEPTNQLLDLLTPQLPKRFFVAFERAPLNLGEVLFEAGVPIPYVYFPCTGLISLFASLAKGKEAEVAMVGREGMAGLPVYLGNDLSFFKTVVQASGHALRMEADAFRAHIARSKPLAVLLRRYAGAFLNEVSVAGACNSNHPVSQRLCRWLLLAQDRLASDRLPFTQEFLARMLAVRLATVSEAASALKRAGLIEYQGHVRILNRPAMEKVCCDCYGQIRKQWPPWQPLP